MYHWVTEEFVRGYHSARKTAVHLLLGGEIGEIWGMQRKMGTSTFPEQLMKRNYQNIFWFSGILVFGQVVQSTYKPLHQ